MNFRGQRLTGRNIRSITATVCGQVQCSDAASVRTHSDTHSPAPAARAICGRSRNCLPLADQSTQRYTRMNAASIDVYRKAPRAQNELMIDRPAVRAGPVRLKTRRSDAAQKHGDGSRLPVSRSTSASRAATHRPRCPGLQLLPRTTGAVRPRRSTSSARPSVLTSGSRISRTLIAGWSHDGAQAQLGFEKQGRVAQATITFAGRITDRVDYLVSFNPVNEVSSEARVWRRAFLLPQRPIDLRRRAGRALRSRARTQARGHLQHLRARLRQSTGTTARGLCRLARHRLGGCAIRRASSFRSASRRSRQARGSRRISPHPATQRRSRTLA